MSNFEGGSRGPAGNDPADAAFLAVAKTAGKAVGSLRRLTQEGPTRLGKGPPPPPLARRKLAPPPPRSGDLSSPPTDRDEAVGPSTGAWGQSLPVDVQLGLSASPQSAVPQAPADESEEVAESTVSGSALAESTIAQTTVGEPTIAEPTIAEPTIAEPTVEEHQAAITDEPTSDEPALHEPTTETRADWRDSMVTTGSGFRLPPPPAPINLPLPVDQSGMLRRYQVVEERSESIAVSSQADTSA